MKDRNHKSRKARRQLRRETQVCPHCFTPVDPLDHFCPKCGQTTGQLTPYIPYLSIRYNYGRFGLRWRNVWNREISWPMRIIGAATFLLVCGPFYVIALPFVIAEAIRTRRRTRNKNPRL